MVKPAIWAVFWCLKLRGSLEIESWLVVFVLTVADEASIADVDISAVVGQNAVNSLYFRAAAVAVH